MNNLYRIPGIVCQGDDGRPVSKPKQTDYENTHTHSLSREVDEVTEGCETCFSFFLDSQARKAGRTESHN